MGYQKAWITDKGDSITGFAEHAEVAKARIMGILVADLFPDYGGKNLFQKITPAQAEHFSANEGADKEGLKWMTKHFDPRTFLVMKRGWLRVDNDPRTNTILVNVYQWDDATKDRLLGATEVWQRMDPGPHQMIQIDEMKTNEFFDIPWVKLNNPNAEAAALKYSATEGVGKFRNPPGVEFEAWKCKDGSFYVVAISGGRAWWTRWASGSDPKLRDVIESWSAKPRRHWEPDARGGIATAEAQQPWVLE